VATGLGGTGSCSKICEDKFANLNNWKTAGTNNVGWEIQNGRLCNNQLHELIRNTCSSSNNNIPVDYSIHFDVANLKSGNGYGVFFRLQDTPKINGYAFQYDPGLGGAFVVRK
jgi:hypothetical protein